MQFLKAFQCQKIMERKIQKGLIETKYQKYIACSYGYKLVRAEDNFSKPFKTYLGEDVVHNFINSMINKSKYWSEVIKKHFNKELVMTKEDNEDFTNSTNYWICENDQVHDDKYRGSADRDRKINLKKINLKIPIVFHN